MAQILQNQIFEMIHVLSRRGKFSENEIQIEIQKINELLKEKRAEQTGGVVTATFEIDRSGIMDIEILVPLNKEISVPSGYTFKPVFKLTNAVKIRHEGNPSLLQESADELNAYMQNNNLTPITVGYNIMINDVKNQQDAENIVVEIYVGINPNIL